MLANFPFAIQTTKCPFPRKMVLLESTVTEQVTQTGFQHILHDPRI